jgi:hypothetical protein
MDVELVINPLRGNEHTKLCSNLLAEYAMRFCCLVGVPAIAKFARASNAERMFDSDGRTYCGFQLLLDPRSDQNSPALPGEQIREMIKSSAWR